MRRLAAVPIGLVVALALLTARRDPLSAQMPDGTVPADPVARLGRLLDRGETSLTYRDGSGYLASLLEHLDINVDSQVLVFSKTSFQQKLISPAAPRAVFFNDSVAVGSVQHGEVLELMSLDPATGFGFYSMSAKPAEIPRFERRGTECVFCHLPGNHGAPGLIVTSVIPDRDGTPFFTGAFFETTDHRTPFERRWGGWYVTGTHGSQTHMGNAVAPDPERPVDLDQSHSQNVTTLAGRFDTSRYLSPASDLVALLTLEHQAGMTSRIVGLSRQYERGQRFTLDSNSAVSVERAIDDLVQYMLFVDEAPLREPVAGVSTFSRTFPGRGPRDSRGRSLRDFDLQRRLFRYPLSFMIYSEVFDRIPAGLRERIYRRLHDVLTGGDTRGAFARLSADDRRAVLEILLETKPTLPAYWWETPVIGRALPDGRSAPPVAGSRPAA